MHLMDNLHWLAGRWVEEQRRTNAGVSLKTLSARCVQDGKLFDRLERGRPIEVPTYERVIGYLADPLSWPAGIPADVVKRLVGMGCELAVGVLRPDLVEERAVA